MSDDTASRTDPILDDLRALVEVESPSDDVPALRACAEVVGGLLTARLQGHVDVIERGGRPHLRWAADAGSSGRILLLGHFDTVWPLGTLRERPFRMHDGRVTGPGVFDMKAGIALLIDALVHSQVHNEVEILLTSDEEIGSGTSRQLIEDTARRCDAVLVCEPPLGDRLKTARKGVSQYRLVVHGRASHAGLAPDDGINALTALCGLIAEVTRFHHAWEGTTVVPTRAVAGSAVNVVPALAWCDVDVRSATLDAQGVVDAAVRELTRRADAAQVVVEGGPNRPPLEARMSAPLLPAARRAAEQTGEPIGEASVGGGSDGNFTAAAGTPTLDGLGAVGGGAHAEDEHVLVERLAGRAAFLGALLEEVAALPPRRSPPR